MSKNFNFFSFSLAMSNDINLRRGAGGEVLQISHHHLALKAHNSTFICKTRANCFVFGFIPDLANSSCKIIAQIICNIAMLF